MCPSPSPGAGLSRRRPCPGPRLVTAHGSGLGSQGGSRDGHWGGIVWSRNQSREAPDGSWVSSSLGWRVLTTARQEPASVTGAAPGGWWGSRRPPPAFAPGWAGPAVLSPSPHPQAGVTTASPRGGRGRISGRHRGVARSRVPEPTRGPRCPGGSTSSRGGQVLWTDGKSLKHSLFWRSSSQSRAPCAYVCLHTCVNVCVWLVPLCSCLLVAENPGTFLVVSTVRASGLRRRSQRWCLWPDRWAEALGWSSERRGGGRGLGPG